MNEKRWQPGDAVILRNTGFFVGEAWATPHIVVRDSDDLVVLYRPEGTPFESWSLVDERIWPLGSTRMDMLRLMYPGRFYAVELYFDTERGTTPYRYFRGDGRFRAWKVNIEAPFRRTEHGFDTTDHFLDAIVKPDRRYFWKDGEVFQMWANRGAYTRDEVEQMLQVCRDVSEAIEAGASPFDEEWTGWRPEQGHASPRLPAGWQTLPGIDVTCGLDRRWDAWRTYRR